MGDRVWYDVCNDFTLEVREEGRPRDLADYKINAPMMGGRAYAEYEDEGWVYFFGPDDLEGESLEGM